MIIFDLDGTLANRDHRLYFVDPCRHAEYVPTFMYHEGGSVDLASARYLHKETGKRFKPDYEAFEDACDKDTPNQAVVSLWDNEVSLGNMDSLFVFTGRSERVKDKTIAWLNRNLLCFKPKNLKMRPIGDYTPDEQLKERWLDEAIAAGETIEMVFDDRKKVVDMWRRRGITCFQVAEGAF